MGARGTVTAADRARSPFGLPHGEPARFVTKVIAHEAGRICCEGRVPPGSPYGSDGRCPSFVLIELAAQAAAALASLERPGEPETGSPVGLLVRVRNTRLRLWDVAEGRVVRAVVRRIASALPLIVYEMSVVDDAGNEVLSGELGIYTGET